MAQTRYSIPGARYHRTKATITRSRFIATLGHAPTQDRARAFLEAIKAEFPDATHNCWAFAAGPPGDTANIGCSDDGEPHNTAGRPMLQTLLHSEVGEIVAVVTRYFGGTKLGTGGLVRAYAHMVKQSLESLPVVEKIEKTRIRVVIDYAAIDPLKLLLPGHEAVIITERYAADVAFVLELPVEHKRRMISSLQEATQGALLLESEPSET
ncbi:MAG: YigZ family protein [Desulfohalobiaceae bacterium]|nr:YigZ family protein [Desulfohalobiaceae bacterium]